MGIMGWLDGVVVRWYLSTWTLTIAKPIGPTGKDIMMKLYVIWIDDYLRDIHRLVHTVFA